MANQKTLMHSFLKLGTDDTDGIRSLFETTAPTTSELNATDGHGDTLVHFAARAHALPLLQLLHQYKANMEAVNEHGRQALHEAIDDLSCVQYLVETCQVDSNAMKRGDWTPVMIAALKGDLAIVQCLVEHGALLHLTTKDGRTPLHLAVQEGHSSVATFVASMYPDSMFMATKSGRLPLQMAAALTSDHRTTGDHLVRTLLSMADTKAEWAISHSDRSGRTVLEDAIVANQVNLVAWLIQTCRAADPTRQDALGRNVWHHAAMVGHVAMLQKLGQWAILRPLLNAADTWDSWTPLMYAAKNGHLECVQCLLGGLLVDPTKRDKLGRTAKDLASLWNHEEIVKVLEGRKE